MIGSGTELTVRQISPSHLKGTRKNTSVVHGTKPSGGMLRIERQKDNLR